MKIYRIELEETKRLKKKIKKSSWAYELLQFEISASLLEGVYVCEHWSSLVILLNIFIFGDKMKVLQSTNVNFNIFESKNSFFYVRTVQNISFVE